MSTLMYTFESPTLPLSCSTTPSIPSRSSARAVIDAKPHRRSFFESSVGLVRAPLMPAWMLVFEIKPYVPLLSVLI